MLKSSPNTAAGWLYNFGLVISLLPAHFSLSLKWGQLKNQSYRNFCACE